MSDFYLVWLVAGVCVAVIAYLLRSAWSRRWVRAKDIYWRGVIVVAGLAGLAGAYVWDLSTKRSVDVPAGVAESPLLSKDE